ncbi:carboxypeptidase-like regulatory domain-containing protein [Anaeromicropila populeti]|uniref:Carboxypeptidase regulatory-like domain-containing protein n=1 Tax=Anaeromicropila populeti TaxID=37658 RepID=A0A1I6IAM0_9FIRM|nr:carboxypeptidase-like regulatory domain-containing protein [Anaeromicropila populeti]SFR63825.1 Carboxypeptidase regulatory-like domain-containing protein [Anaeromicropila populeti]
MSITFPINGEFIALEKDGVPFTDPVGDENPAGTDIVGTLAFPAVYFATDDVYAFFRFRLRGDPRNVAQTGFQNYAWVILFDIQQQLTLYSYAWELALAGNTNAVLLKENLIRNSPGTGFNDQAEGNPILFPITNFDIARAVMADSTLGGVQNYFLDIAMELSTLRAYLGISDEAPLRFTYLTATNENNFNKDVLGNFDDSFSDPLALTTTLSGTIINKEDGSGIAGAKIELYQGSVLIGTTESDYMGAYIFTDIDAGNYSVQITKCCFKPNCFCSEVSVQGNKNNLYYFSLAYDCICQLKCLIGEIEAEVIAEKDRILEKLTEFFTSVTPNHDVLLKYVTLLCVLNDSTAELDCCISKILDELVTCEEEK